MAESVTEIVARAIQNADKSYFNEDYLKQAQAALSALRKSGLELVPVTPSEDMVQFVCDNLPLGRLRQQEFIKAIYILIVENIRRFS